MVVETRRRKKENHNTRNHNHNHNHNTRNNNHKTKSRMSAVNNDDTEEKELSKSIILPMIQNVEEEINIVADNIAHPHHHHHRITTEEEEEDEEESNEKKEDPFFILMKDKFKMLPAFLREGPWKWTAYIYLIAIVGSLIYTAPQACQDFPDGFAPSVTQRIVCGCLFFFGISVLVWMKYKMGIAPMVSYTMQSWTILTLHCGCIAFNFITVSEVIRFPAIVSATVTVIVWWLVLTPIIHFFTPTDEQKKAFWKFNTSPFLLIIHGFNFVMVYVNNYFIHRKLILWDLWIGFIFGITYLLFYLLVLDANGMPIYIIFSPRTHLCVVSFTFILLVYFAIWKIWDHIMIN